MTVERISHYRIDRLLGAGGMGEVYLAEDPRLRRKVALKLLPERFAADSERVKRFEREARAASRLNHPNIITVYEVGQDHSRHYIAVEYIEGETLRERIRSPRPIGVIETVDVGIGIASALTAAHEAGILHRDVKPENVMVRPDGYVKVLDFGLAKLSDDESLGDSSTGAVLGTLMYLSPEQAQGSAPDQRSDVYSLSAVLYEMLTRRPPVAATSFIEFAMAVSSRDPLPPSKIVAGVPSDLDRIVLKGLHRNPSKRYQSARQLLDDLKSLRNELQFENNLTLHAGHGAGVPLEQQPTTIRSASSQHRFSNLTRRFTPKKLAGVALIVLCAALISYAVARNAMVDSTPIDSIAVLPFVNVSGDPNSEYLSDGIAESIIDSLARYPRLQLVARSTTFRYRGQAVDPVAVGNELHVRGVVTGQVIARGETLVIRAALLDVRKGTQVWGEQYNRKMQDVLTVQREMSDEISNGLRLRLEGKEKRASRPAVNPEAYQAILRARYHLNKITEGEVRKALGYFNEAVEIQPDYAPAYAGIADSYYLVSNVYMAPNEAMPRAKAAAERAVQLDDSLPEAHVALALVRTWYDWDFAAGEREFRKALALNPSNADAHRYYGDFLIVTQKFDAALEEKRRAEKLDPLSLAASWDIGRTFFYAGRYQEAETQLRRTLDLDPNFPGAYVTLAQIAIGQHKLDVALQHASKALAIGGRKPYYLSMWAYVNALAGHRAEALAARAELQATTAYTLPLFLARVDSALGERDAAMQGLEKLVAERSESIVWLKVDPTLAALRTDRRFLDLEHRVGL